MYSLKIENTAGQILNLSSARNIAIIGIDGLIPPPATIVTNNIVMYDGSRFNSARVNQRNIVLHMKLIGDVAATRILLYKYFRIKQWCKIYFNNGLRDVYCEGYVETFEDDRFKFSSEVQISIICPSPWFKELNEVVFNMGFVINMFEFPFAIEKEGIEFSLLQEDILTTVVNSGDVEMGVILELYATSEVINPRIFNADTREMMGLNFTMVNGDLIRISTYKGNKYVKLFRNGIESNIINHIMDSPDWFQIPVGETNFTYDCVDGAEFFSVKFIGQNLYEGV